MFALGKKRWTYNDEMRLYRCCRSQARLMQCRAPTLFESPISLPSCTHLITHLTHCQMSQTSIYGVQAWGFTPWVWPLWARSGRLRPTWLLYTSAKRICIHSISFLKPVKKNISINILCTSLCMVSYNTIVLKMLMCWCMLLWFLWTSNLDFSVVALEKVKASSCGHRHHTKLQRPNVELTLKQSHKDPQDIKSPRQSIERGRGWNTKILKHEEEK